MGRISVVGRIMAETAGYEISVSGRNDGTIEAAYVRLKEGKVAKTEEIVSDVLLADYNIRGALLGIEILAPVKIADLAKLIAEPQRRPFRRFIRQAAPGDLVHA